MYTREMMRMTKCFSFCDLTSEVKSCDFVLKLLEQQALAQGTSGSQLHAKQCAAELKTSAWDNPCGAC